MIGVWLTRLGWFLIALAVLIVVAHFVIGWESRLLLGAVYATGFGGILLVEAVHRHRKRAAEWW
jgi:hypothetical protein